MENIILKYLQQTASTEEKKQLLDWLRESEGNKKTFSGLRDIWLASGNIPPQTAEYSENAFRQFKENVQQYEKKKRQTSYRLRPLLRIAASVALILACSAGGYFIGRLTPDIEY